MMLMVGGGSALAEGDLFVRNLTLTPEQVARHAPRPADPLALEELLAQEVLSQSNARRAEAGLGALSLDSSLAQSARRYSQKMRDMAFFSHNAPDGEGLDRRLPEGERYRYARLGENLWSGQGALDWRAGSLSRQATGDWILSPSHRDNLLEPIYDVAGVGVAVASDQVFITMLYAKPQIDAASARLRSLYPTAPTDIVGFGTDVENATLRVLNSERGVNALPGMSMDLTLSQEARAHAQATLAAGGVDAAAIYGEPLLRRVLDTRSNRTNRVTLMMWEASGGVAWQGDALAEGAMKSWRDQGSNMPDILDAGYDRAGIGAATDGNRVFVSVVLSETRDPVAQLVSDTGIPLPPGGNYISLD